MAAWDAVRNPQCVELTMRTRGCKVDGEGMHFTLHNPS